MKQIKVGKNIYPDVDLKDVSKFLGPYGIKMNFLFDDGVEFIMNDDITTKNFPGDLSFYKNGETNPFLIFAISFGNLIFFDGLLTEKELFLIPIYD